MITKNQYIGSFLAEAAQIKDPGLREALERARTAFIEHHAGTQEVSTSAENKNKTAQSEEIVSCDRHQPDFFALDIIDYAFKDDPTSMEAPLYSLSTKKDTSTWLWKSEDSKKWVEVSCNAEYGRATQHDKDILIYCMSQITAAINAGLEVSKTIRFTARDLLKVTGRGVRGDDYERLKDALNRLRGTSITTNIKTGGQASRHAEGFGIIDRWRVIEKSDADGRMVAVEVTLSDWLWNGLTAQEVLTIHPDYFRLRKPLERRLYEIARKHVGKQSVWVISLGALHRKSGSRSVLRNFKVDLGRIIDADSIPEYRYSLDSDDKVTIYTKRSMAKGDT